jgi:hypothetical protein
LVWSDLVATAEEAGGLYCEDRQAALSKASNPRLSARLRLRSVARKRWAKSEAMAVDRF